MCRRCHHPCTAVLDAVVCCAQLQHAAQQPIQLQICGKLMLWPSVLCWPQKVPGTQLSPFMPREDSWQNHAVWLKEPWQRLLLLNAAAVTTAQGLPSITCTSKARIITNKFRSCPSQGRGCATSQTTHNGSCTHPVETIPQAAHACIKCS